MWKHAFRSDDGEAAFGGGGRGDGARGRRDAARARAAEVPGGAPRPGGLGAERGSRGPVPRRIPSRRRDRPGGLPGGGSGSLLGRRFGVADLEPRGRRARGPGCRQLLCLSPGPRGAPVRAGGEHRSSAPPPQGHRRQPQLLDDPDGGRSQAPPRRGAHRAHHRVDLPGDQRGRREGGRGLRGRAPSAGRRRACPGRPGGIQASRRQRADELDARPADRLLGGGAEIGA